jgi:large conductance mechanosensitive channel
VLSPVIGLIYWVKFQLDMGFVKEFKEFAMKGSVVDLAVGVIIGGAFGKIVTALVDDVLMPVIGIFNPDGAFWADMFVELPLKAGGSKYKSIDEARKAGANIFAYGHFLQAVIDFLIIALVIFALLRAVNQAKKKQEAATPAPLPPAVSTTDQLLTEIRDALKR